MDSELLLLGRDHVTVNGDRDDSGHYPNVPLHGLIGQTWKNIQYSDGLVYEGEVADYLLLSQDLFGVDFAFNQFRPSQPTV